MTPHREPLAAPKAESLGLVLDSASFVPYYEQIVDRVRNLIKDGLLHEGEVFCSEGEVARTARDQQDARPPGISETPLRRPADHGER